VQYYDVLIQITALQQYLDKYCDACVFVSDSWAYLLIFTCHVLHS